MNTTETPTISRGLDFRNDIQWFRGLAVLAVILFHAKETTFSNGYLGVDTFFVISGYVVAPLVMRIFESISHKQKLENLLSFYQRRFWRLVPTLGFVIGTSTFLIFLFGSPSEHWRIAQQGLYSLIIVGNLGAIKFSGNYFSPTPNPFIHTWSLSVEEQFYIAIPTFLLLTTSLSKYRNYLKFILLVIVAVLSFVTFSAPSYFVDFFTHFGFPTEIDFVFYSGFARCWQFTIGLLAYLISRRKMKTITFSWIGNSSFIFLTFLLFCNLRVSNFAGTCLASVLTLMALYFGVTTKYTKRFEGILTWIGDRSYSLYLVHMPLLYLAKYSPVFEISSRANRSIQSFFAVIATFLLGSVLFGTIERQSRQCGNTHTLDAKFKLKFLEITLLIPVLLLTALNYAPRNSYWGLSHDLNAPRYPGYLDPNCQRDSDSGPPCFYKSKGARFSVLLIGDSHAGHYSEALITAAKEENWNAVIWAEGSCTFVLGKDHTNQLSQSCLTRNREIRQWIVVNKPQAVIVSQYIYQTSNQNDIKRSLLALKDIVPKVIIIENNPVFPDERNFMVAKPLVMKPYVAPKRYLISQMQYRDFNASTQLASWAEHSNIRVLRTWPLFCDTNSCVRFDKKGWLYFDDDHLSVLGASRITPFIQGILSSR
jgi:peptidoglycan/LPS O-acetylase OafA/YrhL